MYPECPLDPDIPPIEAIEKAKELQRTYDWLPKKQGTKRVVFTVGKFENFGETIWSWYIFVSPQFIEEVQAVILACQTCKVTVRAMGTQHSWAPLAPNHKEVVIVTDRFRDPERFTSKIWLSEDKSEFTVLASAKTGDVCKLALDSKVPLVPQNAISEKFNFLGVLSTASHGSCRDYAPMSEYITAITLVDGKGEIRKFRDGDEHRQLFRALRTSLGLFGVIFDVTMTTVAYIPCDNLPSEAFRFEHSLFFLMEVDVTGESTFEEVFIDKNSKVFIDKLAKLNWSCQVYWLPFNSVGKASMLWDIITTDLHDWGYHKDEVLIRVGNLLGEKEPVHPYKSKIEYQWDEFVDSFNNILLRGLDFITDHVDVGMLRALRSNTAWDGFRARFNNDMPCTQKLPKFQHYIKYMRGTPMRDMEWHFNVGPECQYVCHAANTLGEFVKSEAAECRFPLNMTFELRFTAPSGRILEAIDHTDEMVVHMDFVSFNLEEKVWENFCDKVASVWCTYPGATPHWGKEWQDLTLTYGDVENEDIITFMKKKYGDSLKEFREVIKEYDVDPEGIFRNDTLSKIFFED